MSFFKWLFDSDSFVTRDNCGAWSEELIAIYQLANFLIAIAYFAIPICLAVLWLKIKNMPKLQSVNTWILVLFFSFIFLCGLTHVMHVIVFWYAPYRFFALLDMITAVVSLVTAIVLPIVIYDLFKGLYNEQR